MKKILFTGDTLSEDRRQDFAKEGFEFVPERIDLNEDELMSIIKEYDGYILGGEEIATKKVIENAKKLKVITFFGTGYEKYIDLAAAKESGIVVTNTPNVNSRSVAEFTIALIMSSVKKIVSMNNATKTGMWNKARTWDLQEKTVGIIGMGNIGSIVAKILHDGFGMNVVYYSKSRKPDIEKRLDAEYIELDELFSKSDVISVHLSYNKETIGLVGSEHFKQMKNGAILVNTARAEIIDPIALKQALNDAKINVAVDCYYKEPVPTNEGEDEWKLMSFNDDCFIMTPHAAYNTTDALRRMEDLAIENTIKVLKNEICENTVPR
jgi:Lactate dehydrogenase and related dehydrogenases